MDHVSEAKLSVESVMAIRNNCSPEVCVCEGEREAGRDMEREGEREERLHTTICIDVSNLYSNHAHSKQASVSITSFRTTCAKDQPDY